MKIYIELLVLFALIFMIFIWFIWFKLSKWIAKIRYNPKNDKGRLGEEKRRRDRESAAASIGIEGFAEPAERSSIPTANAFVDGKTGDGIGKTGWKFRNPFRRKK